MRYDHNYFQLQVAKCYVSHCHMEKQYLIMIKNIYHTDKFSQIMLKYSAIYRPYTSAPGLPSKNLRTVDLFMSCFIYYTFSLYQIIDSHVFSNHDIRLNSIILFSGQSKQLSMNQLYIYLFFKSIIDLILLLKICLRRRDKQRYSVLFEPLL